MSVSSCLLILGSVLSLPMAIDYNNSLEAEYEKKPVLAEKVLFSGDSVIIYDADFSNKRATGSESDPDYAVYGHKSVFFDLEGISIVDFNRLCFEIQPDCATQRIINLTVSFQNKSPLENQFNNPAGDHLIHLEDGKINKCFLEIEDIQRDCMQGLLFTVTEKGWDLPMRDRSIIHIKKISAQKVPDTDKVSGWEPQPGQVIYSMSGYVENGGKTALINSCDFTDNQEFQIIDSNSGDIVYSGNVKSVESSIGRIGVLDFSDFNLPGEYILQTSNLKTHPFLISENDIWDPSCYKVLNFIYGQRCGYPVSGIHTSCHEDLVSVHNGVTRSYAGGWHDAGDFSQQTLQTADVTFALLELYDKKKESSPLLAARLYEEALWGLDFIMKNRFGDGYHASSMGLLIWTDGVTGTFDDINTVRIQNTAFDNYLYAAYEAFAAKILRDDVALAENLKRMAKEDFDFACEKFKESGFGGWISPYEHTYCTSESQHMATASWAASLLFELTDNPKYGDLAAEYAKYVLESQSTHPVGKDQMKGFFYRNPEHKSVVHFIHQSREQIYMQALAELCISQPSHPDFSLWKQAIADYGDYIKKIMKYTFPYSMIPSGIYRDDEVKDYEAFFSLHIFPPSDALQRFEAQKKNGIDIGDGYFVKRFPVWFNIYNGNLAVHTSMGKGAAICAQILKDPELMDIAREQLYWIVGKNPFAQSLIYGEGHRYPELNNFSSGRTMGAIPVGIRSLNDTDMPYWPQFNSACYKEVWVTSAGKWLSLVATTQSVL